VTAAEKIEAAGFEDVIIFDSPSYDDALVGVTEDGRAVYDYNKMVAWLAVTWGMTQEDAVEWIDYNTIGALPNAGPLGPVIMYSL
jgi:hypothetical protein